MRGEVSGGKEKGVQGQEEEKSRPDDKVQIRKITHESHPTPNPQSQSQSILNPGSQSAVVPSSAELSPTQHIHSPGERASEPSRPRSSRPAHAWRPVKPAISATSLSLSLWFHSVILALFCLCLPGVYCSSLTAPQTQR